MTRLVLCGLALGVAGVGCGLWSDLASTASVAGWACGVFGFGLAACGGHGDPDEEGWREVSK